MAFLCSGVSRTSSSLQLRATLPTSSPSRCLLTFSAPRLLLVVGEDGRVCERTKRKKSRKRDGGSKETVSELHNVGRSGRSCTVGFGKKRSLPSVGRSGRCPSLSPLIIAFITLLVMSPDRSVAASVGNLPHCEKHQGFGARHLDTLMAKLEVTPSGRHQSPLDGR